MRLFIDMTAAFDKVWRQRLITKRRHLGIRSSALVWIHQFLSRRYITVRYNGTLSKKRILRVGVQQGSVLSLLLFIMYKMGLQEVLPEETLVYEYADDIALRRTGREINDLEIAVNKDLEKLYEWSSELKLELNPGKINQHNFKYTPKRDLNGVQLKKESNPVYLGINLTLSCGADCIYIRHDGEGQKHCEAFW